MRRPKQSPVRTPDSAVRGYTELSRRNFLIGLGAVGLAGCSTSAGSAATYNLGGSDQLTVLNWAEYIDGDSPEGSPTLLAMAEAGLSVNYLPDYVGNEAGDGGGFQLVIDLSLIHI